MAKFDGIERAESDRSSLVGPGKVQRSKACPLCLISLGLILVGVAGLAGLYFPKFVANKFKDASVVCSKDDPDYDGWVNNFQDDATPAYRYFYIFDITNPVEFVTGAEKAQVHEKGPYAFRCKDWKFDVGFVGATVSYKSFKQCAFEPDNTDNCDDCNDLDEKVAIYNAAYAQVLTSAGNEGQLMLNAAGCSTDQIAGIADLTKSQPDQKFPCSWSTGSPVSVAAAAGAECGCCVPDAYRTVDGEMQTDANGMPIFVTGQDAITSYQPAWDAATSSMGLANVVPMACNQLTALDMANPVASGIGLIASTDGAVETDKTWTSSGAATPAKVVSELVIEKSVHDIAFGFPGALAGYFTAVATVSGAEEMSKANGLDSDADLKNARIAGLASNVGPYTADVVEVCQDTCSLANAVAMGLNLPAILSGDTTTLDALVYSRCSGNAPAEADLEDDLKYLAGIDCEPLSTAYIAGVGCALTTAGAAAQIAAGGGDPSTAPTCSCGESRAWDFALDQTKLATAPNDPFSGSVCCIADGGASSVKPSQGCLVSVPGFLNDRNVFSEDEAKKVYATDEVHYKTETGCDASEPLGKDVQEMLNYNGKKEEYIFMPSMSECLNPMDGTYSYAACSSKLPTFYDKAAFDTSATDPLKKMVTVSGKNGGSQIQATGLDNRKWASKKFNDGTSVANYDIFVSQVNEAITVEKGEVHTHKGIDLVRYSPPTTLLSASAEGNLEKGVGVIDGVALGVYTFGLSIGVSFPNFLYGAEHLYTDIDLYQVYERGTGKKLGTPTKMTHDSVIAQADDLSVQIDMEPSTGKAMLGHNRLQGSLYTYACEPSNKNTAGCGLFPQQGMGPACAGNYNFGSMYYPCSAANIFTPKAPSDVLIPTYWIDEWSSITDDSAAKFVQFGSYLQYADAVAIVGGFIGLAMIVFGFFGLCCSRK